jgi:hypothetical protein
VSVANYLVWRKQNHVFEAMATYTCRSLHLGGGSRPQAVIGTISDPDLFTVLRAKSAFGRTFSNAECTPGKDAVIVLSDGFAASQFGSSANAGSSLAQRVGPLTWPSNPRRATRCSGVSPARA